MLASIYKATPNTKFAEKYSLKRLLRDCKFLESMIASLSREKPLKPV